MTREVEVLLEEFDVAYDEAVRANDDDVFVGQACDCVRSQFLNPALKIAKTVEDCDAILRKPYMDRHSSFIAEVKAKRDQIAKG